MQGKTLAMLAVLYGSAFLGGFNENLMNMALMSIMSDFGVDSVTAQWLVTGYMIVATIAVMCMAYLYQRVQLRTLFFVASALSLVGGALGLLSVNFAMLVAARLVQAFGTGIFIPLMMNTILVVTPKQKLGSYMSIGGCMITFGPALAPVVCGAMVTVFGWHSVFVVPVVAMAVLAVLGAIFVRNMGYSPSHLDVPSVILSAVALFCLSFGLAQLMITPFAAAVSLVVAAVAAALFIVRQLRCKHPLINLTPAKSIAFWPALLLATIAMMSTFSLSVLLPLYFEGAAGMTAFAAGLVILVPVLANAGTTLLGGRAMDRKGEWPLLPFGFALITIGFATLAVTAQSLAIPAVFVGALLTYAGVGFIFSPSQTAGLRTLPPEQNPHGVALMTTFVQIAACIGPSMYIGLMSSSQNAALAAGVQAAQAAAQGFELAVAVAAVIALIGCVAAFVYARAAVRRRTQESEASTARAVPAAQNGTH